MARAWRGCGLLEQHPAEDLRKLSPERDRNLQRNRMAQAHIIRKFNPSANLHSNANARNRKTCSTEFKWEEVLGTAESGESGERVRPGFPLVSEISDHVQKLSFDEKKAKLKELERTRAAVTETQE